VDPNIPYQVMPCNTNTQPQNPITYAAKPGDNILATPPGPSVLIGVPPDEMGNVFWSLSSSTGCSGNLQSIQCGPVSGTTTDPVFQVTAPGDNGTMGNPPTTPSGQVQISNIRKLTTMDINREGTFGVTVSAAPGGSPSCTWNYKVHVTSNGGGWGDPHMTTVDGVKYDFQSAGEFTALRGDKFEVQTRQRPVPTANPAEDSYSGLRECVSIYSAVATRIGSNRVTLEPNLSGQPDPSGLQLRVNGELVTLTDRGIDLRARGAKDSKAPLEGRIVKTDGGAYEFDDAFGTQLVATPQYWKEQQTWYMNLNIYQTSASQGIWGRLAVDSWLPALPDGSSMGTKPGTLDQRYQDLYVKFANAWRVTDTTSLFDYAPGTNTATFTVPDWPRFNNGEFPSCLIPGQTPATPTTPQAAEQACNGITDPGKKANCTFDVMVTGNTGFAQTYAAMQEFRPHGTGWQPALASYGPSPVSATQPGTNWPWWWWILILVLLLIVIAVLIARKKKTA
jgi:hypothetical protein